MKSTVPILSIVIPALNEENYICNILSDIVQNSLPQQQYEIIVIDSGSTDKTAERVKEFQEQHPTLQLQIHRAPRKGVSVARNYSADFAQGNYLVFLDADTRISTDFLNENLLEMQKRKLDVGACYAVPDSGHWADRLLLNIANNVGMKILQHTAKPMALGAALWTKRSMFETLKGFDESILFGEDIEYVTLAKLKGRFAMLKGVPMIYSMRRGMKEGRWKLAGKTFHCFVYHMTHKSMKNIGVTYEFGNH